MFFMFLICLHFVNYFPMVYFFSKYVRLQFCTLLLDNFIVVT